MGFIPIYQDSVHAPFYLNHMSNFSLLSLNILRNLNLEFYKISIKALENYNIFPKRLEATFNHF